MRYYPLLLLGLVAAGAALAGWWLEPPTDASTRHAPAHLAAPGPRAVAVASPTPGSAAPTELRRQLDALAQCDQTQSCPVDHRDPYASEYRRAQAMAALLDQLRQNAATADPTTLRDTAWTYLNWPDGHVQSAALALLSALPPVPENVPALTQALQDSFDAPLMRQALAELARYPAQADALTPFFMEMLRTGSLFAGQEVAKGLLPFLTPGNVASYQQLLPTLDPQSAKARDLKAVLAEYGRQQEHG